MQQLLLLLVEPPESTTASAYDTEIKVSAAGTDQPTAATAGARMPPLIILFLWHAPGALRVLSLTAGGSCVSALSVRKPGRPGTGAMQPSVP
jgi:hypothetical protein